MARRGNKKRSLPPDHYFVRSQLPLPSLVFLLPLLALYEWGVLSLLEPGEGLEARNYLTRVLGWFGAAGQWLPALAVVGVLTAWHVARRDPWRLEPRVYLAMGFESLAMAIPLLLLGLLMGWGGGDSGALGQMDWWKGIVSSIGAGIYEELVFRLAAIALLHMLLVDLLKVPELRGATIAIVASSVLFAAAHFPNPSGFDLARGAFIFAAGVYLAVIYIIRGFGVVAATHALYDVMVVGVAAAIRAYGDSG